MSGPLGLAQPTGAPHGHLFTWTGVLRSGMATSQALSHPPIPHHSPYFCPDTELLAFSPPHSLLPSAQVPSSGHLLSQYRSKLSLPSRLQASRPQSGLGWIQSLLSGIPPECPHPPPLPPPGKAKLMQSNQYSIYLFINYIHMPSYKYSGQIIKYIPKNRN